MDELKAKWWDWTTKLNDIYEQRYGVRLQRKDLKDWKNYFEEGYTPEDALDDEQGYI